MILRDNQVKILWIITGILCSLVCACNQSDLTLIEQNGKWGYINSKKKVVIPPKFDDAYDFLQGLARVKMDNKYGFIDKTGKVIIKPQFDWASDFSDGVAHVFAEGKQNYIELDQYIQK